MMDSSKAEVLKKIAAIRLLYSRGKLDKKTATDMIRRLSTAL